MSILKAVTIPAMLTLLLTGVGWLFDRSVQRFESILFLRYTGQVTTDEEGRRYSLVVENQSATAAFSNIKVLVRCNLDESCLSGPPVYQQVPPVVVAWKPDDSRPFFSQLSITFLPVGAKAQFDYPLEAAVDPPEAYFQFPSIATSSISVFTGTSMAAWFASNYYLWLFAAMLFLGVATVFYFGWLVINSSKGGSDERKVETYRVIHSFDVHTGATPGPLRPKG